MSLEALGFDNFFSEQFERLGRSDLTPARVGLVGRGECRLMGCTASHGELSGRLLHELAPVDYPVAGDWVAVQDAEPHAVIHHVFERRTAMVRRQAGSESGRQVIAANVDVFFIVTSANRDLNVRRLERYITLAYDSGASPAVVLNKIDLGGDIDAMVSDIETVAFGLPVLCVSAATGEGMDDLGARIGPGRTVGLIGSSGVGKSTIANRLLGREALSTNELRNDGRGRHTTTSRELFLLPGGGVLIDTPGMRELGLVEDDGGMSAGFPDIEELAHHCRFSDCSHDGEPGCAVAAAVEAGDLDPARLAGFHKLQREIAHAERRQDPAQSDYSKKRWKAVTKAMRAHYRLNPDHKE